MAEVLMGLPTLEFTEACAWKQLPVPEPGLAGG